ncbi:hypothetical protein [Alteribacter aurantiacus]|uniref:hypothetical protein n=1 Tax=Alteribacter aurantiacus TaxID=254410 RepID=UPI0004090421|nr:hypothetical protein [Alteribacter aurantiacus]
MFYSSYIVLGGAALAFFIDPMYALGLSWTVWTVYFFINMIKHNRLDDTKHHKRDRYIMIGSFVVTIGVLLFAAWIYVAGEQTPVFIVTDETVTVTGLHGVEWEIAELTDVQLVEELPPIRSRIAGFSSGETRKGLYRLEELGRGRLFIQTDAPLYLYLEKNDEFLFINGEHSDVTEAWYEEVKKIKE